VFADAGERSGLSLCDLAESTQEALAEVVPHIGAIHNPIDLTAGYFSKGNQEKLERAVRATLADPNAHSVCVNLATTGQAGSLAAAEVLGRIAADTDKPLVVFSSAPANLIADALRVFSEGKVPVLRSPSRAARALAALASYRRARERLARRDEAPVAATAAVVLGSGASLSEAQSKAVLAGIGIPVTRDVVVKGPGELKLADMKAPVVVKVVSADIPHKTEVGGVKLGIATQEELDRAIAQVLDNARTHVPQARIDGVLVSEMVRGGFELIAGVVNDIVFGPVVVVGAGGIYAEILKDTTCRLAPFDEATAYEMLDELQCRPILAGARGNAPRDVAAIARALSALSGFAWAQRDHVQEVDINPLFALPDGVVAADALVVPRKPVQA
jgi:acetyltransferase